MDSLIGSSSLPKEASSNALITIGIIIAGIIKRGEKIQKSIQDTFCSGSENEGDGVVGGGGGGGWVGGRREGLRDGGRCGGGVVVMCE